MIHIFFVVPDESDFMAFISSKKMQKGNLCWKDNAFSEETGRSKSHLKKKKKKLNFTIKTTTMSNSNHGPGHVC